MNSSVQIQNLTCHLSPAKGRYCTKPTVKQQEAAFNFWYQQTHAALLEENQHEAASQLSSDGFLECDEFVTLSCEGKLIGIFMFRWIDLNFTPNQELTAVKKRFPSSLLAELKSKKLLKIMTMGNLAVDPNWRRSKVGLGIADILMGFAVRRFSESNGQVLLTTTRNNRSTNTLCYRQGGQQFSGNNVVFGVESDVVLFYRDSITPHPNIEINHESDRLWNSKSVGWANMPLNFIGNNDEKTRHYA